MIRMIILRIIFGLLFIKFINSQQLIGSNIPCNNNGCQYYCNVKNANKGLCNKYNFCICNDFKPNADLDLFNSILYHDNSTDIYNSFLGSCNNITDANIHLKVKSSEPNFECKMTSDKSNPNRKIGKILTCEQINNKNIICPNITNECEKVYGGNWNFTGKCIRCLKHNQVLEKIYGNVGCCETNGILTTGKDGITKCFVGSGNTWMCYGDTDCKGKCKNPNKSCFCDGGECHN